MNWMNGERKKEKEEKSQKHETEIIDSIRNELTSVLVVWTFHFDHSIDCRCVPLNALEKLIFAVIVSMLWFVLN